MSIYRVFFLILLLNLILINGISAQDPSVNNNAFKQLNEEFPAPNVYRTASGNPGSEYWQQKADYKMEIWLDDDFQKVGGIETITYYNNSPDVLDYVWVQLDQNVRAKDSDTYKVRQSRLDDKVTFRQLQNIEATFDGGFNVDYVRNAQGVAMNYTIVKTMMRVDLDEALESDESVEINISWSYNVNDRQKYGGRSGMEFFAKDGNYIYTIAQFFPRMAVYDDIEGWQNKQFLGRGEFALPFGDYDVKITVPSDHLVAATGTLQNSEDVLNREQLNRWEKANSSYIETVNIVNEKEALNNEKKKSMEKKTWHFVAENVRDFAFASSRKFIWDAMAVKQSDGSKVMACSMYPSEANPLWGQYSTKAVAHTIKWYSHYTFEYPYPIAWSIHTDRIGMEYPMICFNGYRPELDGTYSKRTKYGLISVIIHEVGHNYFPMIVNSDERQWTWMDEGLNTYLQYLTEQQWERNYPSRRGQAYKIVEYMGGDANFISPIMTNSESIFQFGNNAYGKPATALNILRETIVGRELFDFAFKRYSNQWKFKHPSPSDFFRSIEDATSIDLDWFWRGWFYTNKAVDLSIEDVKEYVNLNNDLDRMSALAKEERSRNTVSIDELRNSKIEKTQDEIDLKLVDFYTSYDELNVTKQNRKKNKQLLSQLNPEEKQQLEETAFYYQVTFGNKTGLPMPIIVMFEMIDGTHELKRIPAEAWRFNNTDFTKVFRFGKQVKRIVLDPYQETADININNNNFPQSLYKSRFEIYKEKQKTNSNPMQEQN